MYLSPGKVAMSLWTMVYSVQLIHKLLCLSPYKALARACGISVSGQVGDPKVADWLLEPEGKEKTLFDHVLKYAQNLSDIIEGKVCLSVEICMRSTLRINMQSLYP